MARNSEKAMTALARWRAAYVHKYRDDKKRPFHTIECEDLKDAIIYRRQIVLEMTKAITSIQNPSLSEYKLRDLNDEINKLIKEKNNWEDRIVQLGGPDYKEDAPKLFEKDGKEAPGYRGYRYFGAARDLPGVRELFEEEPQPPPRKTRGELMKFVDIAYYGNCDEDDGVILVQERAYESDVMQKKVLAWKRKREEELSTESQSLMLIKKKKEKLNQDVDDIHQDDENIYDVGSNPLDEELNKAYGTLHQVKEESEEAKMEKDVMETVNEDLQAASGPNSASISSNTHFMPAIPKATIAEVAVYTQEQIEEALVNQKKEELLKKYVSSELLSTISEARSLLGHESREQNEDKPKEVCGVVESLVQKKRIVDANKACAHHPLYDDSADEDQSADEEDDMEDLD